MTTKSYFLDFIFIFMVIDLLRLRESKGVSKTPTFELSLHKFECKCIEFGMKGTKGLAFNKVVCRTHTTCVISTMKTDCNMSKNFHIIIFHVHEVLSWSFERNFQKQPKPLKEKKKKIVKELFKLNGSILVFQNPNYMV